MRVGGCQCGGLRYEIAAEPLALYVCHCRECQKQSASAFGLSLRVPSSGLRLPQGSPRFWSRATDAGHSMKCAFCPTCGSRLWHQIEGAAVVSVKAGSLDEPVDLASAIHPYGSRAEYRASRFRSEQDSLSGRTETRSRAGARSSAGRDFFPGARGEDCP